MLWGGVVGEIMTSDNLAKYAVTIVYTHSLAFSLLATLLHPMYISHLDMSVRAVGPGVTPPEGALAHGIQGPPTR